MPQDTAATWSRIGSEVMIPAFKSRFAARRSATQPPVMAAQRVPPSAWITSQSMTICRSPSARRSTPARSARPIRRWISCVRPDCLPAAASRRLRVLVARGSIPYSAVTQPWPDPFRKGGALSSMLAEHSTRVSPQVIRQDPSAWRITPVSIEIGRISLKFRPEGRIFHSFRGFWHSDTGPKPMPATRECPDTMPMPETALLSDLNDRSREVFRRVVEAYLATGEPVGSRTLTREMTEKVSAATIRNVMQDLELLGLLDHPHISAGRMPTQLGLRLFVDGL